MHASNPIKTELLVQRCDVFQVSRRQLNDGVPTDVVVNHLEQLTEVAMTNDDWLDTWTHVLCCVILIGYV